MKRLQSYQVFPAIPKELSFLETLSRNVWWCWKPHAVELFRRIDPRLWEDSGENPLLLLTLIPQRRLLELAKDDSFLAHQQSVKERFYLRVLAPVDRSAPPLGEDGTVAYFSMEFGIHESIPLFAGGLGVLAGDHLKAASNMALPLVGVGLLYRQGYFHQFLDQEGYQQEEYPETELYNLPLERARDEQGDELRVTVSGPDGDIQALVWKILVGRIPLYLLDANLPENPPDVREISSRLYTANLKMRLVQEVLLGMGGMRALAAMGIRPKVCHMNEGHSAFAGMERLALIMETQGVDLRAAMEIIPRTTVFTTHTPVPAGHDEFPPDLVRPYLLPLQERLGVSEEEIVSWGQAHNSGPGGPFSMFVLARRMAQFCNGVSELHGRVARRMWAHLWPDRPENEIPITHVTNGIHVSTWISLENALLFDRYLGPEWYMSSRRPENAERIEDIYGEELWRAHEMSRARLIRTCREMMVKQYGRRNAPKAMMEEAQAVLSQDTLTIGFARRFATYKRAYLLFQDPERLEAMVSSTKHPVQIIIAGKAHPRDNEGKELIRRIVHFARRPAMRHRMVFLENYDMHLAKHMVQGTDVWLNTPRRPFEACGTSGMKAAVNGVLNVSILDGWWAEAYSEENGWAIGGGEEHGDAAYQDAVESQALYNLLENQVIPCFYDRRNGDYPTAWVTMMKASMRMAMQRFCSLRMMGEYEDRYYFPAAARWNSLMESGGQEARRLAVQNRRLHTLWKDIRIAPPEMKETAPFRVGDTFYVTVQVNLGPILPEEVIVELYSGRLKSAQDFVEGRAEPMTVAQDRGDGEYIYHCTVKAETAGRFGFTARVTPAGDDWIRFAPGLITWS